MSKNIEMPATENSKVLSQMPELVENKPATTNPRVVIVGAGFGGLQAARALNRVPVDVTVIDRSNHHLFQPLLYEVATAVLSPADISAPIRNIDPTSARIILVEAAPRILTAFPEVLAKKAQKALNHLGVEVRTQAPVEAIDENGVVIAGKPLAAKTVIWTAGVTASPAGKWLGVETDRVGRVKVSGDLTIPDHPNIFVIGDTASVIENGKQLPGMAPVAMQEGRYVASMIAHRVAGKKNVRTRRSGETSALAVAPFHYINKGNVATVGRSYGVVEIGKLRVAGFFAWVLWLAIHIFYLIGFRNRILVMFQYAWAYLTFQRGARLITFESGPALPEAKT